MRMKTLFLLFILLHSIQLWSTTIIHKNFNKVVKESPIIVDAVVTDTKTERF